MNDREAQSVRLVAKWLSMRDAAVQFYGKDYRRFLGAARLVLKVRREKTGEDDIHAAMAAFKEADDNGEGMIAALYVATLVDPPLPGEKEKT